jgi:hypothetical protein
MTTRTTRTLTERGMLIAERRIPEFAAKSGHEAYKNTLSLTGGVVVKTSEGQVIERRSDGSFTVLKLLPSGKRVKTGSVLRRAK